MEHNALNRYVNEIIAIAGENDVSWDVGTEVLPIACLGQPTTMGVSIAICFSGL